MKIEIVRKVVYKKVYEVFTADDAVEALEDEYNNWYDSGDDGKWEYVDNEFDWNMDE